MDEVEMLRLVLEAVSGPASAVAVSLFCMGGFGYFLVKHLIPSNERQLTAVLEDSKENRKVFQNGIKVMSQRLDGVEDDVKVIAKDVAIIKERI